MSIKFPWGMTIHTLQQSRPTQATASLHRGDTEDVEDLQHQALPLHCLETSFQPVVTGTSHSAMASAYVTSSVERAFTPSSWDLRTLAPAAQSGSTVQVATPAPMLQTQQLLQAA